ncbi:MAG: 3,4-dihydroxy-2-butanone-4-phosphate synthase [Gammaproteobacteria bacterium]|nr:3,4-dihydroxy-2-butanone-4-phosphate synthase [Gammaproteobacteria bacterium]
MAEAMELPLAPDSVPELIAAVRAGEMVVIMDDEGRENEGDLVMAAEGAGAEQVAFFVRHTSGIVCLPMMRERLDALQLPQMVTQNSEAHRTAFTVSVDCRHGTTTGISAHDRAITIQRLADPESRPEDFTRPGHIFPLRYAEGGVLCRAGHTEASVDLARLAGLQPAAAICEVVNDDGSMTRGADLIRFARRHGLKVGTIADLIRYRLRTEKSVERLVERRVPTEFGEFELIAYEDHVHGAVHLALVCGEIDPHRETLVRVQVQSTLGDVLGIRWPALGRPLASGLERIGREGGVLVLLRQPEHPAALLRQIGNEGAGSASQAAAGEEEADVLRTYGIGAQILSDLGVGRMRVLAAPRRLRAVSGFGLEVTGYEDGN